MKSFLRNNYPVIAFMLIGMAGGFLYWRYVGCSTGSCPITSHWHSSLLGGGILGYLSGDLISDIKNKNKSADK